MLLNAFFIRLLIKNLFITKKKTRQKNLPGLPRKTEEYNRLVASAFLVSAGDDHSLRHHRPGIKRTTKKMLIFIVMV